MVAKAPKDDLRLVSLEDAPPDDMPETDEERAAVARSKADFAAGRSFSGDVVSKALREGRLADLLKR